MYICTYNSLEVSIERARRLKKSKVQLKNAGGRQWTVEMARLGPIRDDDGHDDDVVWGEAKMAWVRRKGGSWAGLRTWRRVRGERHNCDGESSRSRGVAGQWAYKFRAWVVPLASLLLTFDISLFSSPSILFLFFLSFYYSLRGNKVAKPKDRDGIGIEQGAEIQPV